MDLGLEAHAAHAQRLLDAVLVVDDELLRQDVDHLAVHGDGDRLGGVDDPAHVLVGHLAVADGDHPLGVEALDMPPGDARVNQLDLAAGHQLGLLQRLADRLDGALDVDDDAFAQSLGRARADADDIQSLVGLVADDGANLRGSDVQSDNEVVLLVAHAFSPSPLLTVSPARSCQGCSL